MADHLYSVSSLWQEFFNGSDSFDWCPKCFGKTRIRLDKCNYCLQCSHAVSDEINSKELLIMAADDEDDGIESAMDTNALLPVALDMIKKEKESSDNISFASSEFYSSQNVLSLIKQEPIDEHSESSSEEFESSIEDFESMLYNPGELNEEEFVDDATQPMDQNDGIASDLSAVELLAVKPKKKLIPDFLVPSLESEVFGDKLFWLPGSKQRFCILWRHRRNQRWSKGDDQVFQAYAGVKGQRKTDVKARLRQAFHKCGIVKCTPHRKLLEKDLLVYELPVNWS